MKTSTIRIAVVSTLLIAGAVAAVAADSTPAPAASASPGVSSRGRHRTGATSPTPSPTPTTDAAKNPASETALGWSIRMAKSQMDRVGNKLEAQNKARWDYTTGLYCDAQVRLSEATGDDEFTKSAIKTIGSFIAESGTIATYEQKVVRPKVSAGSTPYPTPDLEVPVAPKVPYSLDDVQSGVVTLKLYNMTGEARYKKAADILRAQLEKHPRIPEGGFWHKAIYPNQMWLDGLYMGEPFYADYASEFNEPKDFDDIAKQFELIGEHTYDPATGLFYHGWDEAKKQTWANKKTGTSPSFWGRAIGWYAMALVDVLDVMPKDHPGRVQMLDLLNKWAAGAVKWQDPKTGVWWQVVDKGAQPKNYLESSASSMFVYALAKGVNNGYLDKSYIPAVHAGYAGLIKQFVTIDKDEKHMNVTHCCKVAGLDKKRGGTFEYYTVKEPIVSNDEKVVGPFINAGIECAKLFPDEKFSQ